MTAREPEPRPNESIEAPKEAAKRMSRRNPQGERARASRATRVLEVVTLAGIYGGLLLPLVFLTGLVVYPYVFLKLLFLQILVALTLPAFLVLAWRVPRYRPRFSWVWAALGAHCLALALSVATAADRHRAFWGNQERMNGLFSLLHFVAWFAMASSVFKSWRQWRRLLHWQAALGFAMAAVALLQRPFPTLLGAESGERVAGLLGNAIYSGVYHLFMLFLLAFLWIRAERPSWRRFYAVGMAASAAALWASGSRGPLLGLVLGAAVALTIWAIRSGRRRLLALEVAALAMAAVAYAIIARVFVPMPSLEGFWQRHGALQHVFLADFDPARRHLWAIALRAFHDRPWLGWGLTNYEIVFDVLYDPWFMCFGLYATLQDSSHSLYLDHLSTTGILGLLTFVGLWTAVLASFASALRSKRLDLPSSAALFGLAAAYLVQGIFVFDSPGVHSMVYLLLALAVAVGGPEWNAPEPAAVGSESPAAASRLQAPAFAALAAAGALLAYRASILPGYASFLAKQGHAAFRRTQCAPALALAKRAAAVPTPYFEDQMFMVTKDLTWLSDTGKLERCPEWRAGLEHARALMDRILEQHPAHSRQRWVYANLLTALGRQTRDPAILAEAGEQLEHLLFESPRRQQFQYNYANWLVEMGRVGEAKAHLDFALSQGDRIGESLWRKGVFQWRALEQSKAGAELMAEAMEVECRYGFKSAMEVQQLAQAYSVLGDREHLKGVIRYVENFSKDDRPSIVHLGIARYLEKHGLLEERDQVLALAQKRDPKLAEPLRAWREGRIRSLAEVERALAAPAPGPRSDAREPAAESAARAHQVAPVSARPLAAELVVP